MSYLYKGQYYSSFTDIWGAAERAEQRAAIHASLLEGALGSSIKENERFLANHIGNKAYWDAEIATRMKHGWTMPQEDRSMMANMIESKKWMRISEDAECERKDKMAKKKKAVLNYQLTGSWPQTFSKNKGFKPTRCVVTETKKQGRSSIPEGAELEVIKAQAKRNDKELHAKFVALDAKNQKALKRSAYGQALGVIEVLLRTGAIEVQTEEELHCLVRAKTEEIGGGIKSLKKKEERNALKRFL